MSKVSTKLRVLRAARHRLVKEQSHMVCLAIEEAGMDRRFSSKAAAELQEYVQESLGIYCTLGAWQRGHGLNPKLRDIRQDRLDWIDWIIANLAAQEAN